jgi:hypothetical protein
MTATRKKQLQRQLAMQRGQAVNNLAQRLQDRLKNSTISVIPAHLNIPWTKMIEQVKNEKASTGAPSAPTGASTPPAGATPPTATGGAPK